MLAPVRGLPPTRALPARVLVDRSRSVHARLQERERTLHQPIGRPIRHADLTRTVDPCRRAAKRDRSDLNVHRCPPSACPRSLHKCRRHSAAEHAAMVAARLASGQQFTNITHFVGIERASRLTLARPVSLSLARVAHDPNRAGTLVLPNMREKLLLVFDREHDRAGGWPLGHEQVAGRETK